MTDSAPVGNHDFDAAGRAVAARETAEMRAAVVRSTHNSSDELVRQKLGPEARVVSSTGGRLSTWERISADAQRADAGLDQVDGYPTSRHYDPDTVEAENRRLGRAVTVAKHH